MSSSTSSTSGQVVSRTQLFLGFLKIGLMGFGGTGAIARHVIVEDRAWLSEKEYAAMLGLGQVLPGGNIVNVAVMIGDRYHGVTGSMIAVVGLMAMPIGILIVLASLYDRWATIPDVRAALIGAAAGAAGLVMGTAIKMASRLSPTVISIGLGILAFVTVGVLRLPLVYVIFGLVPLGIAASFLERRS
jgi:chromate transporter